ncbi:hypothetical protein H4R26_002479 [Coemansia thaxteri]|uniref:Cyclase n=1 Tax=Coemansia thaxteri TaxID=2663907 RepID=A0A9W8BCU8_9FUNG|nr:hypothetical protein H4R26_002479 [Coemansia thaxteri]KAJ2484347.1 hypothetical protein EV174_002506 [Coemansia sp. RSA 2320]
MRAAASMALALAALASAGGHERPDLPAGRAQTPWPPRIIRSAENKHQPALWSLYDTCLSRAKYIDLTHTIRPDMPIWRGFGNITFRQAVNKETGRAFAYDTDGFVANAYTLTTDQMGTQLDAPAHFNPYYAAADEIPATFALRKLVVIDVSAQVKSNASYALTVADITAWESVHGVVPPGSVVFVRSDWSKPWPVVNTDVFPQVPLDTVKFLHLQRRILFHGHEPLDTDMTPHFDAESWILSHGYAQAEGLTNLHQVPPTGCLLSTGFPKFVGGTGNYVRYVAVCPHDWTYGLVPGHPPEAPLPHFDAPLVWNPQKGYRSRS